MRSWWLAVDFGTVFTTAAHRPAPDGPSAPASAELLEFDASRYLPSAVFLAEDDSLLVGRHALSRGAVFPERLERSPKRALAAADHVRLAGTTVPVVDLVTAVLRTVAVEARRRHDGSDPGQVTLTHPARWGDRELSVLALAAKQAHLPDPAFLPEPVAAARHYLTDHQESASDAEHGGPYGDIRVAVYDLGGGTLDTAVLRAHSGVFDLAGPPGGAVDLGGTDLDHALHTVVARHAESLDAATWTGIWSAADRDTLRTRDRWRTEIVRNRELLSDHPAVTLYESGFESGIRLTRGEYEAAAEPLLRRSVRELSDTIARAGLTPADLTAVYLTGGASRTPLISSLIHDALGVLPTTAGDPKSAVVLGALAAPTPPTTAPDVTRIPAQPPPRAPVEERAAPQAIPPQPTPSHPTAPRPGTSPFRAPPSTPAPATNHSLPLAPVPGAWPADAPAAPPPPATDGTQFRPPGATEPGADIPHILRSPGSADADTTWAADAHGRLPRRPSRRSLLIALLLGWWAVVGGYSEYYRQGAAGLGGFSGGVVFCCLVVIFVSRTVVRRTQSRRPRRFR